MTGRCRRCSVLGLKGDFAKAATMTMHRVAMTKIAATASRWHCDEDKSWLPKRRASIVY
jgi:hypothetical protein